MHVFYSYIYDNIILVLLNKNVFEKNRCNSPGANLSVTDFHKYEFEIASRHLHGNAKRSCVDVIASRRGSLYVSTM